MNARGLISKQNKLQSLINMLEKTGEIHSMLLCETWLTEDTEKLLKFDNHKFIGREWNNKKGGSRLPLEKGLNC